MTPNFAVKIFANSHKTAKFVKVLPRKCDPLSENLAHPAFYENWDKTGNRYIDVYLCSNEKMAAISCLIPQVTEWNASQTQNASFQEKAMYLRCYGKLQSLCILSCYIISTRVLVKKTRQRQLKKTVVVKVEAYIVSIDRKTTVYKVEACEIAFFWKRVL